MKEKMKAMLQKTKVGTSMVSKVDPSRPPVKNHFIGVPSNKKP